MQSVRCLVLPSSVRGQDRLGTGVQTSHWCNLSSVLRPMEVLSFFVPSCFSLSSRPTHHTEIGFPIARPVCPPEIRGCSNPASLWPCLMTTRCVYAHCRLPGIRECSSKLALAGLIFSSLLHFPYCPMKSICPPFSLCRRQGFQIFPQNVSHFFSCLLECQFLFHLNASLCQPVNHLVANLVPLLGTCLIPAHTEGNQDRCCLHGEVTLNLDRTLDRVFSFFSS